MIEMKEKLAQSIIKNQVLDDQGESRQKALAAVLEASEVFAPDNKINTLFVH